MRSNTERRGLRVLHAIHDFLPRHRAGSEIYAAALCRELSVRHHVTLLCADYDPTRTHGQIAWRLHDGLPVIEIANNWLCDTFADTYRSPLMTARVEQALHAVQPDVLHVHNLLNLSFDVPAVAQARGIPVVATLHDYTLVCASGGQRVHRADAHVCHSIDPARCARCFSESPFYTQAAVGPLAARVAASGTTQRAFSAIRSRSPALVHTVGKVAGAARPFAVTGTDIEERLAQARAVFTHVDVFVAPSPSIAEEFVKLGVEPSKVQVSDYGFARVPPAGRSSNTGRLRIGFVGTLVWHKGAHVLLDAVRGLSSAAYEVRVYGDVHRFPEYVSDLRRRAQGLPVHFMGGFDGEGVATAYADIDVLVVPSLWLENSPLVIHEAFMAGVPVVGSRMGGIAGLIADGRNGRLFDPRAPEELTAVLQSIITDRAQLSAWTNALPPVKTIAENALEYERIYLELAEPRRGGAASPS